MIDNFKGHVVGNDAYIFSVETVVQGYYEYKDIWDATIDGLELPCERKPGIHMTHQP